MEKIYRTRKLKGVEFLFIIEGFGVMVINEYGDFYGGFQSYESAVKMILAKGAEPLRKGTIGIR